MPCTCTRMEDYWFSMASEDVNDALRGWDNRLQASGYGFRCATKVEPNASPREMALVERGPT